MNRECENCGAKVSGHYARVFGDQDNKVHRCGNCVDPNDGGKTIIRHGGAAFEDIEDVEERMKSPRITSEDI